MSVKTNADFPATTQLLYEEAELKLQHANEILSHGFLMPGKFNGVEIRRAMQEASEAVAVLAELDLLLKV